MNNLETKTIDDVMQYADELKMRFPQKKSMQIYYDTIIPLILYMSNEEVGEFIKAIGLFEIFGEKVSVNDKLFMMYESVCRKYEIALDKYEARCKINAENARRDTDDEMEDQCGSLLSSNDPQRIAVNRFPKTIKGKVSKGKKRTDKQSKDQIREEKKI